MGYTSVDQVTGMFPTFQRGSPQQRPSDTLIQQYIDDVAAEIDAVLTRRGFVATGLSNVQIRPLLSAGALDICEMINRFGAARQLGETLATFGVIGARDLARIFRDDYERLKNALDARDAQGRALASGSYDKYFDPLARTETAQPALQAIAGGDQPSGQTPADTGSSQVFGKFDKRGS